MAIAKLRLLSILSISTLSTANLFPAQSVLQVSSGGLDDIDISSGSEFNGLTTFAHLPYVPCFSNTSEIEDYDIAFLGAPFDTVGLSEIP